MKDTRILMGMPITVDIADTSATAEALEGVYDFFASIDARFSTYKDASEISRINRGEIAPPDYSDDMRTVFRLAEETKRETDGFFDIRRPDGSIDPSGIVKGWSILLAARLLDAGGFHHFFVDAGGDVQVRGRNTDGDRWRVGIRNPFRLEENVRVLALDSVGVATSGTYVRGRHIYDPHTAAPAPEEIVSLTVVGPDVYEADRFATAAFAMGRRGIGFIEQLPGLEGYMIDAHGSATLTSGFDTYAH